LAQNPAFVEVSFVASDDRLGSVHQQWNGWQISRGS
jgi:hypothetical protein